MEVINKEQNIKNGIEPVSIEQTEKIINQMKNCVCKIYSNGSKGTGFFTKIPYKPYKNELMKVLITNNHVLNGNSIEDNKIITYIINNNEDNRKTIRINNKRKRYTDEKLDVTIIEIDEQEDDVHNYIEIDYNDNDIKNNMKLNKKEILNYYNNIYKNESIYILNYMNRKNILVSYGIITGIDEEKGIKHKCNTYKGSSGAPILSLKNNKLIGIHYGYPDNFEYNLGNLIIYAIIEFNKKEEKNENKNEEITNEITNKIINSNTKLNTNLNTNEITIIYKISEYKKKIQLFDRKFIENNKNNCKIIIDNKEQEIIEYIDINEEMKKKGQLEIKLKEIKTISNMSYMFAREKGYNDQLILLPDISKWDTQNVTNMSHMFRDCGSLSSLPDISKWDTQKVTNMSDMFSYCESLSSLPDISKWKINKVTNMSDMFSYCESLSSLPDISKWDTQNVTNISDMFSYCESLSSLPDISKWKINNVNDISGMFSNCYSLSSLPDISKWDTKKVTNMSYIFSYCESLSSLPDISKWDTQNVTDISDMFSCCESLSTLPDISE